MEGALAGVRIVEVSAFVAAPLGGMTLAQLGADVIRIDPLGGGLDYRRWPVTNDNTSLFWCGLNKSKRSVTVDFTSEEGRELVTAMITAPGPDAGILLTNFPPRGFLDYKALSDHRSDLIQLTVMGDRKGRSAVDYTVNPRLGLPMITGTRDSDAVCNHVLPAWDLITGNMAAIGILSAERVRRRTGEGQHVTLALEDVALAVMGHLGFLAEAQTGGRREKSGNDLFGAFGRDFVTADRQRVMVVGLTQRQWRALCKVTGIETEVAKMAKALDVDLDEEGVRYRFRDDLATLIGPWIAQRTFEEVAQKFDKFGVCWGRYQSVNEMVETDPECSIENPLFSLVDQPGVGRLLVPGLPLRFSAIPSHSTSPAPLLGEHTDQVLAEILGLSTAEIGQLMERKTIGRPPKKD